MNAFGVLIVFFLLCVQSLFSQTYLSILNGEEVIDSIEVFEKESDTTGNVVVKRFNYANGNLAKIVYYRNGKQNGRYKSYYPNGTMMEYSIYGNGLRHGEITIYDEKGNITVKGKYKNGLKHGFWAYKSVNCYGKYKKGNKSGTWYCQNGLDVERIKY